MNDSEAAAHRARLCTLLVASTSGCSTDGMPRGPFVANFQERLAVWAATVVVMNTKESPLFMSNSLQLQRLMRRGVTVPRKWAANDQEGLLRTPPFIQTCCRLMLAAVIESIAPFVVDLFEEDDLEAITDYDGDGPDNVQLLHDRLLAHVAARRVRLQHSHVDQVTWPAVVRITIKERLLEWIAQQQSLFGRTVVGLLYKRTRRQCVAVCLRTSAWCLNPSPTGREQFTQNRLHAVLGYGVGKSGIVYSAQTPTDTERYTYTRLSNSTILYRRINRPTADANAAAAHAVVFRTHDFSAMRPAAAQELVNRVRRLSDVNTGLQLKRVVRGDDNRVTSIVMEAARFESFLHDVLYKLPALLIDSPTVCVLANIWSSRMLDMMHDVDDNVPAVAATSNGLPVFDCTAGTTPPELTHVFLKVAVIRQAAANRADVFSDATPLVELEGDAFLHALQQHWSQNPRLLQTLQDILANQGDNGQAPSNIASLHLLIGDITDNAFGRVDSAARVAAQKVWTDAVSAHTSALERAGHQQRLDAIARFSRMISTGDLGLQAVQQMRWALSTAPDPDYNVDDPWLWIELGAREDQLRDAAALCAEIRSGHAAHQAAFANVQDSPWHALANDLSVLEKEVACTAVTLDATSQRYRQALTERSSARRDDSNWEYLRLLDVLATDEAIDEEGRRRLLNCSQAIAAGMRREAGAGSQLARIAARLEAMDTAAAALERRRQAALDPPASPNRQRRDEVNRRRQEALQAAERQRRDDEDRRLAADRQRRDDDSLRRQQALQLADRARRRQFEDVHESYRDLGRIIADLENGNDVSRGDLDRHINDLRDKIAGIRLD